MFITPPPPSYATNHPYYTSVLKTFILSKILGKFDYFAFYGMYVAFYYFRLYFFESMRLLWAQTKNILT